MTKFGTSVPVARNLCSGCKACATICPNGAITMVVDGEGFAYPKRDNEKCVKCRMCEKVCHVFAPHVECRPKVVYAVKAKDIWLRYCSSSGGVFSVLASQCLSEGGIVYGVGFEKGTWRVVHKAIVSEQDLDELRGSKYVQSDVPMHSVMEAVLSGRKVMFVGTPCQVAAVKRITGNPDNLLTVDLICHGVPSPLAWKRYLEQREEESGRILDINMRSKEIGWQVFSQRIEFTSGDVYHASLYEDSFLRGFLRDVFLRPSCYECSCRGHKSGSDLTLGDYWGVSRFHSGFADDDGVSALLINTEKGQIAVERSKAAIFAEETDYEYIANGNSALMKSPRRPLERDVFFNLLKKDSFDNAVNSVLKRKLKRHPKRIGVLTFHSQLNYGGVLQCSALRTAILELAKQGTEVFVIDRWMTQQNELLTNGFSNEDAISFEIGRGKLSPNEIIARYHGRVLRTEEFINKNLNLTNIHFFDWSELTQKDIELLSLDLIVVGSDQVWHFGDWGNPKPYLLENCPEGIPAISYAASFGVRDLGDWAPHFRHLLGRFSALSCREQEGVKLCSEIGYTAEHVIDPIGLVDFSEWIRSLGITDVEIKRKELLFYCIEEDVESNLNVLSAFAKQHGCVITVLVNRLKKSWKISGIELPAGVEIDFAAGPLEFIQAFRRAKWVLTDSFHALMFSIIGGVEVRVLRPMRSTSRMPMFARIEELAKGYAGAILSDSINDALSSFDKFSLAREFDKRWFLTLQKQSRRYLLSILDGRGVAVQHTQTAGNLKSELWKKLQSLDTEREVLRRRWLSEEKARGELWSKLQSAEKAKGEQWAKLQASKKAKGELWSKLQASEKAKGELWSKLQASEKAKGELWLKLQASEKAKGEQWSKLQASEKTKGEQWSKLQASEKAKGELWSKLQASEEAKGEQWSKLQASEKAKGELWSKLQASEEAKGEQWSKLQASEKAKGELWSKLQASEEAKGVQWSKLQASEKAKGELWSKLQLAEKAKGELWSKLRASEKSKGELWSKLQSAGKAKGELWSKLQASEKAKGELWSKLQASEKSEGELLARLKSTTMVKSSLEIKLRMSNEEVSMLTNRLRESEKRIGELQNTFTSILSVL